RAPLGAHHQSRAGGLLALEVRPRTGHSEHAAARAQAADRAPARPRTTHAYSRAAPDPWRTTHSYDPVRAARSLKRGSDAAPGTAPLCRSRALRPEPARPRRAPSPGRSRVAAAAVNSHTHRFQAERSGAGRWRPTSAAAPSRPRAPAAG